MPLPQKKIYDLEEAREKIMRFCAYQERSQRQVSQKLKSYGLLPHIADELLIELIQNNYLNEQRFASAFARGHFKIKGWGKTKIAFELRKHGVSKPCIASAMAEIEPDSYSEKLQVLAQKKWESLNDYKPTRKQKLIRYLMNKGYEYAEIAAVLSKLDL